MEEKAEISADISILTTDSDIYTEKQLYVQALPKNQRTHVIQILELDRRDITNLHKKQDI